MKYVEFVLRANIYRNMILGIEVIRIVFRIILNLFLKDMMNFSQIHLKNIMSNPPMTFGSQLWENG